MPPERDRVFIAQMIEAAEAAPDVDLALDWKTVREDLPGLTERPRAILVEDAPS